jgi:glutamate racemase
MHWVTGALKLIPLILTAITAVEKVVDKKGKAKEDAAIDLVGQLVPLIEASVDRDVVDDAAVQQAMRDTISATVSLMNIVRDVQAARHAPAVSPR